MRCKPVSLSSSKSDSARGPRGDPFVPAEAANVYRGRLGSQTKIFSSWDDPYHLIVQGQRKEALATTIIDWLENQLGFVFEPKAAIPKATLTFSDSL